MKYLQYHIFISSLLNILKRYNLQLQFVEEVFMSREGCSLADFFLPKQTKESNSLCFHDWINWINKLTLKDNTVYTVLVCLYVADPATFLAPNSFLGPYFPLRKAGLFTDGKHY